MHRLVDVAEVHRIRGLLAEALAAVDEVIARGHAANEQNSAVVGDGVWHRPDVDAFVQKILHLPAAKVLLELCASAPGQWIAYEQVHQKVGHEQAQQTRNELSAMTRHANRLRGRPDWPVEVDSGAQLRYRADARVAAWLLESLAPK